MSRKQIGLNKLKEDKEIEITSSRRGNEMYGNSKLPNEGYFSNV